MSDFVLLDTPYGTCQVAKSLSHLNIPWEDYLAQLIDKSQSSEELRRVSGVSVRGWICDGAGDEIKVLLGQRVEGENEAFGGKCDPEETILEALVREIYEETNLVVSVIHEQLGKGQIFFTSKSRRWIEQLHFLVKTKPNHEIRLNPEEHQNSVWASVNPFPRDDLPLTDGSFHFLELAVERYKSILID
ncbi:hypothetical protein VI817_007844 [Penicillium citrinum]|nr:hypothetical protein VI817_007844 [Penicillium citrinum]